MFRAVIAYDGTHYFGWQATKAGPTIQETLSQALLRATQEKVIPEATSRTDRGVHAEGQVIAFPLQKPWDPKKLLNALNAHLPEEIRICSLTLDSPDFHPTLAAKEKEYHYHISCARFQHPIERLYAWHIHTELDLELMENTIPLLLGTHNFSSFTSGPIKNPICTLSSITLHKKEREGLKIVLRGDRFLYKMVRTIVGTLVYIGRKKLSPDCIKLLFETKDRKIGGVTAPAHGLFLHKVLYSTPL